MISCTYENGDQVSLRHVTVNTIVIQRNMILLGKRGTFHGKPLQESGKWGLLGGFLDRDENLTDAIKREVLEESGWEIDQLELFRINDNPNRPKEDRQNVDIVFLAQAVRQVGSINEEVRQLQWFPITEIPPLTEFAFDHGDNVMLYKQYLEGRIKIPQLG